jgi:uncharacterized protein YndB with AHSA1/START domain
MAQYEFMTLWHFEASLEDVWKSISHPESWPCWWHGLEGIVELEKGDENGVGNVRRFTWKGLIPYRLVFDIRTTRIDNARLIAGTASGDLEGTGTWQFAYKDGLTVVQYDWRVRTTKNWMNILEPVARPLFRWNHDNLMENGRAGLAAHLRSMNYGLAATRSTA